MKIDIKPTKKQSEAWLKLTDKTTNFVVFGGGAGGGKSWQGAEWLLTMCLSKPGTKWFLGREELKRLMSSSYITFLKVCSFHNVPKGTWILNGQYNYIQFSNGSRIDLLDLKYLPSDPLYERFGSLEYTGGWIEEAGEVNFKAFDILKTRIGRHLNKEYNILPTMFITCNPKKNWLYFDVYKKWKNNELNDDMCFIQSLYGDNPHTSEEYGKMLSKISDKSAKERLMFGNWEYDDDPSKLFEYDDLIDMFSNEAERGKKYLIVDPAGRGKDRTVLSFWNGYSIYKIIVMNNISVMELDRYLKAENIPRSHCLVDEDGVGFGLVNDLPGIKGFVNNARPIENESYNEFDKEKNKYLKNYKNLKAQCWFLLSDLVQKHVIGIYQDIDLDYKTKIIEDLEVIKRKDPDKDAPLQIISKEEIKEILGRSTDFGDCLIGETKIKTNKGDIALKNIKIGDKVITPYGERTILDKKHKRTKTLLKIKLKCGSEIYCTDNHKVYLNGKFIKVKDFLMRELSGERFSLKNMLKWRIKKLFTKEKYIGFYPLEDIITKKDMAKSKHYIEEYLRIKLEDLCVKDTKFTILMGTISTIIRQILLKLKQATIENIMVKKILKVLKKYAYSVESNLLIKVLHKLENIAQTNVSKITSIKKKNILKKEIVYSVDPSLKLKNQIQQNAVVEVVRLSFGEEISVYDIKVEKDHCYYANNILVSNCVMMRMFFEINQSQASFFVG